MTVSKSFSFYTLLLHHDISLAPVADY